MYQELRQLGLTKYETKIYHTLLEYGKLPAQDIAKYSGVPPTAVYPNLKSLITKQLLQEFSGKIKIFAALEPETAFASFVEKKKKELFLLQQNLTLQAKQVQHKKELVSRQEVLRLSVGKEASEIIYKNFMSKAKNSLYILGWRMYTVGEKYSWLQRYKQLLQRGVDVRLILTGKPEKQWELIKAYQNTGIKTKYLPLENFSLVICDGKECKITLKSKDLPEKINMHINDKDLAQAMHSYFLMSWEKAGNI